MPVCLVSSLRTTHSPPLVAVLLLLLLPGLALLLAAREALEGALRGLKGLLKSGTETERLYQLHPLPPLLQRKTAMSCLPQ
jgi:uncharacterized membrane protein YjjP (DUF1212 family)